MIRTQFKTLAGALMAVALTGTSSFAVEQSALRAYWSFDQVGGSVAIDSSGNGNDATLEAGAQMVAHNAVYGGALEIFASEGRAYFNSQDLESLTVSAHFYLDSLASISGDPLEVVAPRIIEAPGFAIFVSAEGPSLVFEYRYDDFLESKWRLNLPGNILGRWWHFAVSFNKYQPATPPVFYIDGVKQTNVTMVKMTAGQPLSNEGIAYIGNREDKQRTMDGYIDDLRIYGSELTDAEVVQLGANCASGFFEAFPTAAPQGNAYYSVWMGYVQPDYYPWLYHYGHGWMYPSNINGGSGWFFNNGVGWLYTTASDPNLLYTVDHGWLYYSEDSMNPRLFYAYDNGAWLNL